MEKCTEDVLVDWMIQNDVINETDRELYKYAWHSFILLLSPLLFAGVIGLCLGSVKQGIALVMPFMVLRKFSGGYHAKKLSSCIIGSGVLLYLCMKLAMQVKCDWQLAMTTIIAAISLIVFSPIGNENRILESEEKQTYKKITVLCVVIFLLIDMILFLLKCYTYVNHFSVGIQLAAILQVPCVFKICFLERPKKY